MCVWFHIDGNNSSSRLITVINKYSYTSNGVFRLSSSRNLHENWVILLGCIMVTSWKTKNCGNRSMCMKWQQSFVNKQLP